ncbi:MAG: DUF1488 family protein [Methylococcaceae bacterium]|nr:DUF1488 family protein [Methylococcaceae bacterium]
MISFPRLESWNTLNKVATIVATTDDKKRVLCRISMEILIDKFGASEEEPMQSVAEYRTNIEDAARKLIENKSYEDDGSILIHADDF